MPSPNTTVTASFGQDTQGQDGLQEGRHLKAGHGRTGVTQARQGALCCACTVCTGAGGGWPRWTVPQQKPLSLVQSLPSSHLWTYPTLAQHGDAGINAGSSWINLSHTPHLGQQSNQLPEVSEAVEPWTLNCPCGAPSSCHVFSCSL